MDPNQTLIDAAHALTDGHVQEASDLLEHYNAWRSRAGYMPAGDWYRAGLSGDDVARDLARRIADDTAEHLSAEFEQMLHWHMNDWDYETAVRSNSCDPEQTCATHEFIDSNETMEAAFQNVIGRPSDPASADDAALINAAWSQWRARSIAADDDTMRGDAYRR